ncbi:MAG: hypothetical protein HC882_05785, partial [Acidobacteria bacterium]|nr:hypothetical protein [Acidobacteriota bacterium]
VSASPADLADAWAAAWKAGGAAVEALVLLSRSGAALAPGPARRLERALFSLAFSDEAALQGARRFFQ